MKNKIPVGWQSQEIGGICRLINGKAFKPEDWSKSGLPIIRIQNLNKVDAPFNYFQGVPEAKYLVENGQLLFAWSGTPGTSFGAHVWDGPTGVLNQHIFKIEFDEKLLDKTFFRHAINQKLNELIGSAQGGVGLRHVTKGTFEKTKIIFPSLIEQKRIVAKLDSLLARVESCRAHLDRAAAAIKRFRQSILNAAVSGVLTENWKKSKGEKKLWEKLKLGDLLVEKPRNGYSPKSVEYHTSIKTLSLSATTSGEFQDKYFKYLDVAIPDDSYLWLEPDDILIQRANSLEYVGVSAIYTGQRKAFIYPDLMMKCRANRRVMTKFLFFLLSSDSIRRYFRSKATGTAGNMPKINQQIVISAPVMCPPLDEQSEIIRKVQSLLGPVDQMESKAINARQRIDNLTASILAKAFRGELV